LVSLSCRPDIIICDYDIVCFASDIETGGLPADPVVFNCIIYKRIPVTAVLLILIPEQDSMRAIFVNMVILKNIIGVLMTYRNTVITVGI
jgi:hypothetical protein